MPRRRTQRGAGEHRATQIVEAGQVIPRDGTVIEGIASVDESALTGESAPVIREAGSERCTVIAGTVVVWGRIVVDIGGDGA